MKTIKISIIMPFFNCEAYLDASISSILNQTFIDFEFIIINDASTDNSDDVIQKYIKQDKRIVYIKNKENKGIVYNLNKGVQLAKGEYIARMDGDDISHIERLEKQHDFLTKNKHVDMVSSWVEIIDDKNILTGRIQKPLKDRKIKKDLFQYLTLVHGCIMIKKSVYKTTGLYREKYLYTEDNDWTYRALLTNDFSAANIGEYLYQYRKHGNSSNKRSKLIAKRNLKLRKETIKNGYKPSLKDYFVMYLHYITGILLTGGQKEKLERILKKVITNLGK